MNKTRIDFQVAAFDKRPAKWVIHHCGFCKYPCGYVFDSNYECVAYDRGCDCTVQTNINECSWDRLAEQYNMQTDEEVIKKMDEFWGFDNAII